MVTPECRGASWPGGASARLLSWLAATLMIAGAAHLALSQDTTSRIPSTAAVAGLVRDSLGHPIMLASISVDSTERRATSSDSGQFMFRGLPPGHVGFHVLRIGYEPLAFVLDLPADSTLHIEIRLHGTALLNTVVVRSDARSPRLAKTGFYDRQRTAFGQFLTPEQVASSIVVNPSELLTAFHGINVECGTAAAHATGGGCLVAPKYAPCLWLFVDGTYSNASLDEITARDQIVAVEFYDLPAKVPSELQGPEQSGHLCASLAVWTKLKAG